MQRCDRLIGSCSLVQRVAGQPSDAPEANARVAGVATTGAPVDLLSDSALEFVIVQWCHPAENPARLVSVPAVDGDP